MMFVFPLNLVDVSARIKTKKPRNLRGFLCDKQETITLADQYKHIMKKAILFGKPIMIFMGIYEN